MIFNPSRTMLLRFFSLLALFFFSLAVKGWTLDRIEEGTAPWKDIKTAILLIGEMGDSGSALILEEKLKGGLICLGREKDIEVFGLQIAISPILVGSADGKVGLKRSDSKDFKRIAPLAVALYHKLMRSMQAPVVRSASAVSYAYGGPHMAEPDAVARTACAVLKWLQSSSLNASERKELLTGCRTLVTAFMAAKCGDISLTDAKGAALGAKGLDDLLAEGEKTGTIPAGLPGIKAGETGIPLESELAVSWRGKGIAAGEALDLRVENTGSRPVVFWLIKGMVVTPEDDKSQQMGLMLNEDEKITLAPGEVFSRTVRAFCLEYEKPLPPKSEIKYQFVSRFEKYVPLIEILRAGARLSIEKKYQPAVFPPAQYDTIVIQRTIWRENQKLSKRPHTREIILEDLFFEMERMRKDNIPQVQVDKFSDNIWKDIVATQDEAPREKPVRAFSIEE
ncbi:MAG: hypothetical protein RDV48_23540 [Candidatus Eremiobacteraeota bacterium]|nr:hypothetical protein [Candidatus Eremiobacteraeota bacterium]